MFPGVNPSMISFMLKSKLDEIIKGEIPEGLTLKEKIENKIILKPTNAEAFEGIKINSVLISVNYKEFEIILSHE